MRRTYKTEIAISASGEIQMLNLGADYCAEHEQGIRYIKQQFGISDFSIDYSKVSDLKSLGFFEQNPLKKQVKELESKTPGLPSMMITKTPILLTNLDGTNVKIGKKRHKFYGLTTALNLNGLSKLVHPGDEEKVFSAYWDNANFAVISTDKNIIHQLFDAFQRKDIAIWLGGAGPFRNPGLVIAIASNLSGEFIEEIRQADLEYLQVHKAAIETDIHKILAKAGLGYYALLPKFVVNELKFFLNPHDQDKYNFGWFTARELADWAHGYGPVIK